MRTASIYLAAAAPVWLLIGVVGIFIATGGQAWVMSVLPALAIGPEAVGGAGVALSSLIVLIGGGHLTVAVACLRAPARAGSSAVLLAATLAVAFVALSAAAFTTAARQPEFVLASVASGLAALLVGAFYATVAAAAVIGVRRSGRR